MSHFTFLLTNPSLWLETGKASTRWSLSFDAKAQRLRRWETFKIFWSNNEYDGYGLDGKISIQCSPSEKNLEEKLKPGVLRFEAMDGEARLVIWVVLPSDTFFRLHDVSQKVASVELHISIDGPRKYGFSYGPDMDGGDVVWRIDNTDDPDDAPLDSLRFAFLQHRINTD